MVINYNLASLLKQRNMKKLLYMSSIVLLSACGTEESALITADTSELDALKTENIQLKNQQAKKDSLINAYALYINEIQENLAMITGEQGYVATKREEGELLNISSDIAIQDHIRTISELVAKNDAKIVELKRAVKSSGMEISEFEKMVITLSEDVATKNHEIFMLQQELENIDAAYSELFVALDEKQDVIDKQQEQLNMAWYAIGSAKELKNAEVISREGGLLGIGKTNKLKADFNHDYFTEIDITTTTEVPLGGKNAELLTAHPSGSFTIDNGKLTVVDYELFWSVSKYLVVVIE